MEGKHILKGQSHEIGPDLGEGERGVALRGAGEGVEAGQVHHQAPLAGPQAGQLQAGAGRILARKRKSVFIPPGCSRINILFHRYGALCPNGIQLFTDFLIPDN